jgi:hypothetical protein
MLLSGMLGLGAVDDSANLVPNPGFEEVRAGKPLHWKMGGISDGGQAVLAVSRDEPKAGRWCAHFKGDAEWAAVNSARIPVRPGNRYELRAYVRAGKGHGYVKFDYFKDDQFLGMTSDDYVTSAEWTLLRFTSELENYPSATHLIATLVGGDGEFEVWFDDVSITKK